MPVNNEYHKHLGLSSAINVRLVKTRFPFVDICIISHYSTRCPTPYGALCLLCTHRSEPFNYFPCFTDFLVLCIAILYRARGIDPEHYRLPLNLQAHDARATPQTPNTIVGLSSWRSSHMRLSRSLRCDRNILGLHCCREESSPSLS